MRVRVVIENGDLKPEKRDRRDTARLVGGLILLVLSIAFVVDNTRDVTIGFVFADHRTRLIYVLVATALIGAVLDRLWIRKRHKHE